MDPPPLEVGAPSGSLKVQQKPFPSSPIASTSFYYLPTVPSAASVDVAAATTPPLETIPLSIEASAIPLISRQEPAPDPGSVHLQSHLKTRGYSLLIVGCVFVVAAFFATPFLVRRTTFVYTFIALVFGVIFICRGLLDIRSARRFVHYEVINDL